MAERWFQLLSDWQDKELRHSLTFPFLIGALRSPVGATKGYENAGLAELKALIDEMRSHHATGYVLHIYHCGDRDKYVLTRIRGFGAPPDAVAIPPVDPGATSVLFASVQLKKKDPVSSLSAAIWKECSSAVEKGLFSVRGRLFQEYDQDELNFIRKTLA
jgi:hypothetical protein